MRACIFILTFLYGFWALAQNTETSKRYVVDVNGYYGSIALHNPDIAHLITEHPAGFILSLNRKRFGENEWEALYNYPDTGYSFIFHEMGGTLGSNYSIYRHYSFYFLKRNLQLRLAQGVAVASNPYDKTDNFRNNAYGSRIMSSNYAMLNYHNEHIYKGFGLMAGISAIHYSNGNIKAPNTSTNSIALNVGVTYDMEWGEPIKYSKTERIDKFKEPLRINAEFKTGVNQSDVIGSGQYPFYIFAGYVDKRLGRKSALQLGTEIFYTKFLKELIEYQSVAFPEYGVQADDDYKRVGLFLGHELFINKMSFIAQLGYYVYYPFDFEGRIYNRIGFKRYMGDKWYGVISLKSHAAAAEAIEVGVGVRF